MIVSFEVDHREDEVEFTANVQMGSEQHPIIITDNRKSDNVEIFIDNGGDSGFVSISRSDFKKLLSTLKHHFLDGLEVLTEDWK